MLNDLNEAWKHEDHEVHDITLDREMPYRRFDFNKSLTRLSKNDSKRVSFQWSPSETPSSKVIETPVI